VIGDVFVYFSSKSWILLTNDHFHSFKVVVNIHQ